MNDVPATIANAIANYTQEQRNTFLKLRGLIYELAVEQVGIGPITETTKWGEPAYLTEKTKSGTNLRVAPVKGRDELALFVNCQTNLIEQFKTHYEDQFEFQGVRAVIVPKLTTETQQALKHCMALTLLYHRNKA